MSVDTAKRDKLHGLRRVVDLLRSDPNPTGGLFVRAMDNFLTAVGYKDLPLMKAAREEAKVALEALLTESIEEQLRRSNQGLAFLDWIDTEFEGTAVDPDDEFDELGRGVSKSVLDMLRMLRECRVSPAEMVQRHGFEVANLPKLDEHIARWEAVKADLVDGWPWTDAPFPPMDREMVARSRAAFAAGEPFEDIDSLIERLRAERPQGANP